MRLKDIGEFGLIKRFQDKIKTDASVVKRSGDDCAVLKLDKNNYQLFTCDMIIAGTDFKNTDDLSLVGRKALAVSISDISACGGIPKHAVVSMGLMPNMPVARVDRTHRRAVVVFVRHDGTQHIKSGDSSPPPGEGLDATVGPMWF